MVISQLGQTLVHTADSVIVGQFAGTVALAAVALGTSVFMTVLVAGIGIAYGLTPLIAQANGRGDRAECGRLLGSSLLLNIGSGIVLSVLILFGFEAVLEQLGQDPAVVDQARPFLQLLAVSLIPLMVFNTFKQFAEGLGFTRQAMNITLWGNALNIIVGIVLVKGMFGIEPMGVRGAGLATLIDRVLMSLAMGFYIFRSERFRAYRGAFRLLSFDRARSLQLLKIGGPVALQFVFEVSAFSVAAIMAGTIGATAQAAHQVAINLASMTYMMASGVASAAAIKSGNHFGARNFTALRLSALSSYHIVIGFMSLTALLFILGNNLLPYMYTSDTAVITIAAQLLIFAGLFQLFDGGQVVGLGILRGMSDVQVPTAITFIAYWVVGLPMAYLLGLTFGWGVSGIWTGLTFGLLVSAVLLYLRVRGKIRGL